MESLKLSVKALCLLSTAVSVLSLMVKGKALAGQLRFLLSLLFAVGMASAFVQIEVPADLEAAARDALTFHTRAAEETILHETAEKTAAILRQKLQEAGVNCTELSVDVHRDEDGCISITKVYAACDDLAAANTVLADLLGEEVECSAAQILTEAQP